MGDICLALDIATRVGFAFDGPTAGMPTIGSWEAPRAERDESGGYSYGGPLAAYNRFLRWRLDEIKPAVLVFEAPLPVVVLNTKARQFQTTSHTIRLLIGFVAITECAAFEAGIDCFEKDPQSVKHYAIGNRAATKEAMMARCRQLNWPVKNDDEADASLLWAMAKSLIDPKFNLVPGPLFAKEGR